VPLFHGVSFGANAEPRYQQKALSEWLSLYQERWGDVPPPGNYQIIDAIQHIGTNARPWLKKWIRSDDPILSRYAVLGYGFLRDEACREIPELTRQMNDWHSLKLATNAALVLASLGKEGLPSLTPLATNQASPVPLRLQVVQSISAMGYHMNGLGNLTQMGTNARTATPVLVDCLRDKDWQVAAAAANGLGAYTIEPKLSVPALAACLFSRTNALVHSPDDDDPHHWHGDVSVRHCAASALGEFGEIIQRGGFEYSPPMEPSVIAEYREVISLAVPALVKALSDEDYRVAYQAAISLGRTQIEPELVVPALANSLKHPEPMVRRYAASALGKFGEAAREAIPALTRAKGDAWPGAEWEAADALKKITSQAK